MPFYDAIMEKVSDIDIGVVILNAGVSHFGYFADRKPAELQEMLDTNVYQYGAMFNKACEKLRKRDKSKRSAIIAVSSINA